LGIGRVPLAWNLNQGGSPPAGQPAVSAAKTDRQVSKLIATLASRTGSQVASS